MRRCYGCMKEYNEKYEICPYCGYVADTVPEVKSHLLPGTKLSGRFVVGKAIGHGGFGITYIAWDEKIQKTVAVKEYFPNAFSTRSTGETLVSCFNKKGEAFLREGVKKMLDEAKRLSKFSKNENIVDISDYFEENNTAYIVMEYLEGKDLKKYLEENGEKLAPEKAVEIILPVLNALEDMHKENLIHRDISPDNIFLCDNGKVKLLDFGSARLAVEDSDKSLSVMVKRGYAPKEQYASRSKQGTWTDVYAVCATLYRMITGKTPVESTEREDEPLKSFSEYGVKGYDGLEKVIFKGLEVDYTNRTRSVSQLREMLKNPTENKSEPVINQPDNPDKPKSKLNIKAILAAVAAVAVIVAGVVTAVKFMPDKKTDTAETTTAIVTEEVEFAINASEAEAIYEEFLSSNDLRKSYPTVHAFMKKDISLLSQDKKEEFDIEMLGIYNLDSSVIGKEYCDFDNDGINELLLSLDVDGQNARMNVYLFDINEEKKVFEGASWGYVCPSRLYNHITVMQYDAGDIGFIEFSNDGSYWRKFVKSVYDGEKLVPVCSLSIPDYQLLGYSAPNFAYCDMRGKSLYSPMGRPELEYPNDSEIISVSYEKAYFEMDKLFGGTKIAGFCDDSWDDWEKIKISESGKVNDSITWKLYENGYMMIEGKGDMPCFDVNTQEEIFDQCPWREIRNKIVRVGVSKGITHISDNFACSYKLENAFLPDGIISIGDSAFAECYSLTSITIPDSVTSIGDAVFWGCSNLEEVTIGNSLTSIGEGAFYNCISLTNAIIPDSVTSIGDAVFCGCSNLAKVTIGNGLITIGERVFVACYALETIFIPKTVNSIALGAFDACTNLKSISVDSQNLYYANDKYGALYNKKKTTLIKYPANSNETNFDIPTGVTSILFRAFEDCMNLTNITIPNSVTNIDSNAFEGCKNLKEITIPGSVDKISADMFVGCDNLESIILLDGVEVIGNNAFTGCKNLKSITIPSSVTSVDNNAFADCKKLTDVYYSGSKEKWDSISVEYGNENLTKAEIWYTDPLFGFIY